MIRPVCALAFLVAGCDSGGGDAPSCQQAFEHYYGAGCVYVDLNTGEEIPVGEMILSCRNAYNQAPASCIDELDDWLICTEATPSPATAADCADCSAQQEALARCD